MLKMITSGLHDFLSNEIREYCLGSENRRSPLLLFVQVPDDFEAQTIIQSILGPKDALYWLIFDTYGSFDHHDEKLFPILQLIREMLFIDEEILNQNALLPPEDKLPQIGDYIIPEFLQPIDEIENLFKLIAKVATDDEKNQIFNGLKDFKDSDSQKKIEDINTIYQSILRVFGHLTKDLYEVSGMIFIYNQLNESDNISLQWLKYSATVELQDTSPLLIIACYPKDLKADFLNYWPKDAYFKHYVLPIKPIIESSEVEVVNENENENESESESENDNLEAQESSQEYIEEAEGADNNENIDSNELLLKEGITPRAMELMNEAQLLYDYLIKKGKIHVK